jgi:lipoyl-dependent peroxiredoxin
LVHVDLPQPHTKESIHVPPIIVRLATIPGVPIGVILNAQGLIPRGRITGARARVRLSWFLSCKAKAQFLIEGADNMAARTSEAEWKGDLLHGKGTMKLGSGAYEGQYSFSSRFESGVGTNPEELIAAAHAGCFSMALSAGLGKGGFTPTRIHTTATVHLEKVGEGFNITRIELNTEAQIPNIDAATFAKYADDAKKGCPVSKVLAAAQISLNAKLV